MSEGPETFWDIYPLPMDQAVVRIVRDAEKEAESALLAGRLVYVRGPRKCGKSSLMERLAVRLAEGAELEDGRHAASRLVVKLDLNNLVSIGEAETFAFTLANREQEAFNDLVGQAGLSSAIATDLRQRAGEGPAGFWRALRFLADVADTPIVIFIDEIEEVLGEHRALGESWLVGLRQAHIDAGGRLAVCCLGMMPASLLVRSPERTPFNTAMEIRLPDFTLKQVKEMAVHLGAHSDGEDKAGAIGEALHNEAAGQPNMTQHLLKKLQEAFAADPSAVGDFAEVLRELIETDEECQPSRSNTYMALRSIFKRPSVWPSRDALTVYAAMLQAAEKQGRRAVPTLLYDPWSDAHTMLEAIGLARVERQGDEELLVARSRIARRMFDRRWATQQLHGLSGAQPEPAEQASQALKVMEAVARDELCAGAWALEHKAQVVAGSGRERTPGTLFEFELVRENPAERLTLQMFRGLGEFGRRLWLRQVRTLRHLSGRAEALPNIYRGGLLDDGQVAYIITHRPELTLADPGFPDYATAHRAWALEQFRALASGLDRMAEEGISHRNIWPGAIRMDAPQDNASPPQMKLGSFEFSVMLRSIVVGPDYSAAGDDGRLQALRAAFLRQPQAARLYAPPEVLDGLFGAGERPVRTVVTGDVFSLGMVVLGWFMPLPSPAAFESVLRQEGPAAAAYDAAAHSTYLHNLYDTILQAVEAHRLPAGLARLLLGMLNEQPGQRLLAADVVRELDAALPDLRKWSSGQRKPLLACYAYAEMSTELRKRGALTTAPDTEADQRTVESILKAELARAELFHAPRGIAPFVSGATDDQRAAEWVLMGPTWLFYCQRYQRREGFYGAGETTQHVLRLAYAWPRRRAWRSVPGDRERISLAAFGAVELAEQRGSPALRRENDENYSTWDVLLDAARRVAPPPAFEVAQTAFTWVSEAQREALELQRFPVKRADRQGGEAVYQLDEAAFEEWQDENVMRSQVAQADRLGSSADRFEQLMQAAFDDSDRGLRLRDRTGGGDTYWSDAYLKEVSGGGVTVRGRSLPAKAWLELNEVRWSRGPVKQQEDAIDALAANPALFDQLLQPYVVVDEEIYNEGDLAAAVDGLAGRSPEIVRKIVTSSPLVALQGPPGTGKTTVIAAVVQGLLAMDETQRVLITSQSNAAVDNIALRLLDQGLADEDQVICVRVGSDRAFQEDGAVDARVRELRPDAVADRIARRLRKASLDKLAGEFDPGLRKAYERLAGAAADGGLELAERVRESAAVVFATTAGSRRVVNDGFLRADQRFDMAIVDEASKAWPMEIVQPMLLAVRSLLVGDHRQLPAFGSTDMDRLLQQCIDSRKRREEFNVLANNTAAIKAWLRLFASFFENSKDKLVANGGGERLLPGWRANREVAEQLTLQFRMRSDIASMISRAFYGGTLESHPSVDTRPRPAWLSAFSEELGANGRGVVWIDARRGASFTNASPGLNLDQAQLAARLLARADALGADRERREAVILSPYKAQRGAIRNQLSGFHDASLSKAVHTADSFQGQEAELVILPLTRGPPTAGRETGRATERYGFLVEKERTNVMMSRARELLVIIGDFDFYADAWKVEQRNNRAAPMNLSFWQTFCDEVTRHGCRLEPDELPPHLQLKTRP